MKKPILISFVLLAGCANPNGGNPYAQNNMNAGAHMLDSILSTAAQMQQQNEATKQTQAVMNAKCSVCK